MKNFIGMFLPFFIFLFLTLILFFFLKGDNSTPCDGSSISSDSSKGVVRSKVQEIFKDVEVKDKSVKKQIRDTIPFLSSSDNLEITNVRWSKNHNGYERIVFDVSDYVEGSFTLGRDKRYDTVLHGEFLDYDEFLASLPSFSSSRVIKKMEVFSLEPEKGFSFTLWLHHRAKYKIFALSNPSRIVLDIK